MDERMQEKISRLPFTEQDARAMIGHKVVVTVLNILGEPYEVEGTLVDVRPKAQYPWALFVREKRKRKWVNVFYPTPETLKGLKKAK